MLCRICTLTKCNPMHQSVPGTDSLPCIQLSPCQVFRQCSCMGWVTSIQWWRVQGDICYYQTGDHGRTISLYLTDSALQEVHPRSVLEPVVEFQMKWSSCFCLYPACTFPPRVYIRLHVWLQHSSERNTCNSMHDISPIILYLTFEP